MSSEQHLAYFQASPVRGQLEPYDTATRTGWRYLQCTDTPNELKVLLPPRTAGLYAHLLQYESAELAKGRGTNWDRILEIRHLKDRMIRKCQRISRMAGPPGGASAMYRIVHAAPDFRLKEMEKWLKAQEAGKSTKEVTKKESMESARTAESGYTQTASRSAHTSPRSSRHSQASTVMRNPPTQRTSTRVPGTSRRRTSGSPRSTVYTDSVSSTGSHRHAKHSAPAAPTRNPYLSPVVEEASIPTTPPPLPNPYGDTPSAERYAAAAGVENPEPRPDVTSPEPLPYLYRPPSVHMPPSMQQAPSMMQTMGMPPPPELAPPAPPMEMPYPETGMPEPSVPNFEPQPSYGGSELSSAAPSPPSELAEGGPPRPTLPRRRSSLRQSIGRSQKVVSWAMDRDWTDHMTKFDHIVYAAETAGEELEQERRRFHEELTGVKDLRTNISAALERLRLETEKLQLEETTLHQQEHNMSASFERLRERESSYKHKVHAALEETRRVVIAADNKREAALPMEPQ